MKEICVKIVRETPVDYITDKPTAIVEYWKDNVRGMSSFDSEKEFLVVLILDSKLKVKAHSVVSMGLLNQTLVHAREVFRPAIAYAGAHIVLVHNHPSNDPTPSSDDLRSTREMLQAGVLLGIPLLDHVVIASNGEKFSSLRELGLLQ